MDRETVVEIINNNARGKLTRTAMMELFLEYCCIEHNKDIELTKCFITILFRIGVADRCFTEILKYYKNKLNIVEIRDSNNRTILAY